MKAFLWYIGVTLLGYVLLEGPNYEWPPTNWGNFLQALGWLLMLGPTILVLLLITNRLANISFKNK